jgi:IS4 transposase
VRWEGELLFKRMKSQFGLAKSHTTDGHIVEALIIIAAISLLLSRVIVEELRAPEAK